MVASTVMTIIQKYVAGMEATVSVSKVLILTLM